MDRELPEKFALVQGVIDKVLVADWAKVGNSIKKEQWMKCSRALLELVVDSTDLGKVLVNGSRVG